MDAIVSPGGGQRVEVASWPSEAPLQACVVVASLGIWTLLAVTIFGLAYALAIAAFFFFAHVAFVAHLRGSAVRLGPDQFPELHARVVELARRAGLAQAPEAYLLESGGTLNALATRLFRGRMIVLFSDLLEACGADTAARDMVIGHELGHLRAGHLDLLALTAPGRLVPFLGSAYSRACEHTCDRWGAALCGEPAAALRGLAILAAGGAYGPRVNLSAFVAQRESLDTGWMTIGRWLSTHPPLSARIAALEPALGGESPRSLRGPLRALGILGTIVAVPTAAAAVAVTIWLAALRPMFEAAAVGGESGSGPSKRIEDPGVAAARAQIDFASFSAVVDAHRAATGSIPADEDALRAAWDEQRPGEEFPVDPFDGLSYIYEWREDGTLIIESSGPDIEPGTDDDLVHEIATAAPSS